MLDFLETICWLYFVLALAGLIKNGLITLMDKADHFVHAPKSFIEYGFRVTCDQCEADVQLTCGSASDRDRLQVEAMAAHDGHRPVEITFFENPWVPT